MRAYLMLVAVSASVLAVLMPRVDPAPRAPRASQIDVKEDPTAETASDSNVFQDDAVELQRASDGHFYADVDVNGTKLHMLVDTGATGVALSREDARAADIGTSIAMNDVVGEGADGSVHGEVVSIDRMSLGRETAQNLPAVVLDHGERSLLGQSFLAKFNAIEVHGDTMTLH